MGPQTAVQTPPESRGGRGSIVVMQLKRRFSQNQISMLCAGARLRRRPHPGADAGGRLSLGGRSMVWTGDPGWGGIVELQLKQRFSSDQYRFPAPEALLRRPRNPGTGDIRRPDARSAFDPPSRSKA
jgi:hypothetical protein